VQRIAAEVVRNEDRRFAVVGAIPAALQASDFDFASCHPWRRNSAISRVKRARSRSTPCQSLCV